ncbi:hypothetical protein [Sutcliffiella horikoshii]|nr:hypothetical protein [Sutcliffiella horikoshii]
MGRRDRWHGSDGPDGSGGLDQWVKGTDDGANRAKCPKIFES